MVNTKGRILDDMSVVNERSFTALIQRIIAVLAVDMFGFEEKWP